MSDSIPTIRYLDISGFLAKDHRARHHAAFPPSSSSLLGSPFGGILEKVTVTFREPRNEAKHLSTRPFLVSKKNKTEEDNSVILRAITQ
jgi:hypothetical protein